MTDFELMESVLKGALEDIGAPMRLGDATDTMVRAFPSCSPTDVFVALRDLGATVELRRPTA